MYLNLGSEILFQLWVKDNFAGTNLLNQMGSFKNLTDHFDQGILTITITRPQAMNALNLETLTELAGKIQESYQGNEIRGIIITGDGEKGLCGGRRYSGTIRPCRQKKRSNWLKKAKFCLNK